MFWQKSKKSATPKQVEILGLYLASSLPLLRGRCADPHVKAAAQVFILGMADMFRQKEGLNWQQFVAIYSDCLGGCGLLPKNGVESLVQLVGAVASRDAEIEKLMLLGAQSIRKYVADRDADAPADILFISQFAERDGPGLSELIGA